MVLSLHIATVRSILLFQLGIILLFMIPAHTFAIRRELTRIWRSINAPFLQKKQRPKKRSSFWEIDMTKFEP